MGYADQPHARGGFEAPGWRERFRIAAAAPRARLANEPTRGASRRHETSRYRPFTSPQ